MKTEELIIDGRRVDMSPDTRIVLNFKSNLLGDISKITASNSQTISLPKTIRNREIFDHATAPSYDSRFRYRKHAATYSRNGVKIISDATAVLLDSAENYEIALYWGEMTKFQSWVDSGLSIKDLDFSTIYQIWNNPVTLATCYNGDTADDYYFPDDSYLYYVDYDCGLGSAETMTAAAKQKISLHPVMSARRLLLKMQSENGITFEFPAGFMDSRPGQHSRAGIFQGLAIPMLTRKTSEQQKLTATVTGHDEHKNSMQRYAGLYLSLPASSHYTTETKSYGLFFGGSVNATAIKFATEGKIKFDIYLSVQTAVGWPNRDFPGTPLLELGINDGKIKTVPCRVSRKKVGSSTGWDYYVTTVSYTYEAEVKSGDELALLVRVDNNTEFYKYYSDTDTFVSPYFLYLYPPATEVDIQLGQYFRVNGNLPDIKQIDFVKALCAMYGLFVVPSGVADKLKFVTLDNLLDRRGEAVDWSSRVIRSNDGEPERVKFSLGDYARRNFFRYAEDDTVKTSGDGEIFIDNEALEPRKDVIKLPFSPSDETIVNPDNNNLVGALIPQYKWNDDGTEVESSNLKPRILQIVSDGTVEHSGDKAIGRFLPITFDNLIAKYYGSLSRVLNSAITITEKIRLTEFELLKLDFTRPVYLKQYGRFYGIISVQTGDDDICTVELLQFPESGSVLASLLYSTDNGETWVENCPTGWVGRLIVKTMFGATITGSDMSSICSKANSTGYGRHAIFTDCAIVGDTVSGVSEEIRTGVWSLDNIGWFYLPKGTREVSRKAFYYARKIRQFYFEDGIQVFARQSFEYCYELRTVEFPASVTYIGETAFAHCYKLTTIRFYGTTPPEVDYSAFHLAGDDLPATTKQIFVPAGTAEAYYAQSGIARLVDDLGFTIVVY